MAHKVKCYYCGQTFDRDKEPAIKIGNMNRYAHRECNLENADTDRQEQIELEEYIKKLFKMDYVHPGIKKQINEYIMQNGFSYSGIYRTLVYYFEILHNSPTISNPTIGIVPYVYPAAKEYYYKIHLAQELNKGKEIYKPTEMKVTIQSPKREPINQRKVFVFLDEEETDGK